MENEFDKCQAGCLPPLATIPTGQAACQMEVAEGAREVAEEARALAQWFFYTLTHEQKMSLATKVGGGSAFSAYGHLKMQSSSHLNSCLFRALCTEPNFLPQEHVCTGSFSQFVVTLYL